NMADENVPAPAPIRSNDQILPFAAWVPIRKSNYVMDLQKKQKNPIFQIALDENWFTLDANLPREALEITPIDQAHPFVSPLSGDAIMDFVNELGYWETFLTDKANLGSPTKKGRKDKHHVIPYCWFTKLIICHLGRTHNIHQISASLFDLAEEDLKLGNLTFVSKGEVDEEGKKTASAKQPKSKSATEKSSEPAPASKPKPTKEKPSKPSIVKPPKPKPAKKKSTKSTPLQKAGQGKVAKVHNVKSSFQLVDEPDEEPAQSKPEPEPEHQCEGDEYDMERAIQMSL
ncbi:hypothetical protein Tco_1422604, partial [Tanacetum coccineum]